MIETNKMVPPPPPPPPAPPQNPAGTVTHSTSTSVKAVEGRSQLLSSIRAGKQLKKTITIDKSGPLIPKSMIIKYLSRI